ncbi:hypothetical protein ACFSYH_02020 [Populibacterium corticicola]|uniref:LPXTG cell wall anchor domain-containing protein n=1 Tax=Populibacterium corticicola TaxID=1812826 RepID=A0ABW5XCC2_9MICO
MFEILALAALLHLGGSDAPTPYTVDPSGITLPAGRTFDAYDVQDANIRTTTGDTINIHFEPGKSHALAGSTTITWTQLGLQPGDCIAWIQLHGFNEHYGEGGQEPVCIPTPEPEPWEPPYECPLNEDGIPLSPRGCDWPIEICNWDNCTGVEPPEPETTETPEDSDTPEIPEQPVIDIHTPHTTEQPVLEVATDTITIQEPPTSELANTGTTTSALAILMAASITTGLTLTTHNHRSQK